MPKTRWKLLLGFGGSVSYIVIKPPQKQISICAPSPFAKPREMQEWVIPYKALSGRPEIVMVLVSVDLSQDLLLAAVQGEDTRCVAIVQTSSLLRKGDEHYFLGISLSYFARWTPRRKRLFASCNLVR